MVIQDKHVGTWWVNKESNQRFVLLDVSSTSNHVWLGIKKSTVGSFKLKSEELITNYTLEHE